MVKNGLPVPGREDHDPALLEVADRAAADVGLGDLGDLDRRHHAGVGTRLLERVLERQRVEHRGQHPHVVGGGPVHAGRRALEAAVDVAGADHDRDLHPRAATLVDLVRDPLDPSGSVP